MKSPTIQASMDRRLLVNYRVDPDLLASMLPPPSALLSSMVAASRGSA